MMTNVWGLVVLVFVPVMGALMAAFSWLTHVTVRRSIGRKHRALEEIHLTSDIPAFWTAKYDRKLRKLETSGGSDAARTSAWLRRRRDKVVSELERLIAYTRRTRLVAEEEVRGVLLDELQKLHSAWKAGAGGASPRERASGPVRR
ncbi:hypothetical protein [Paenibacillus sp. GYB003]|uniref:hypothetical protein n=1 Tax=Paenibacillus sp. GYB003 TaxID=2994392 RepID=UPI002F96A951